MVIACMISHRANMSFDNVQQSVEKLTIDGIDTDKMLDFENEKGKN